MARVAEALRSELCRFRSTAATEMRRLRRLCLHHRSLCCRPHLLRRQSMPYLRWVRFRPLPALHQSMRFRLLPCRPSLRLRRHWRQYHRSLCPRRCYPSWIRPSLHHQPVRRQPS